MALKCLGMSLPTSEQNLRARNLPRELTFALISLILGPAEEKDRNLEKIEEICKNALLLDAAND